jgi:CheY-like chemotaxis protein
MTPLPPEKRPVGLRWPLTRIKSIVESAVAPEKSTAAESHQIERRRRKRAKIAAQIRVRPIDSSSPFQEVCKTVDVSRDGILFVSPHSGYWVGQHLEVTFPYSTAPSALNNPQPAQVVRVFDSGGGHFGVAVQFANAVKSMAATPAAGNDVVTNPARGNSAAVVLVVESDARMAGLLRGSLEADGYTVVMASTAQSALDILKTTVPAVLVAPEHSDIDGHDLCHIVRRNDRLQHVPLILVTQLAQPADSSVQQLGAVVSVAKSSKPDRLVQMIRLLAPPPAKGGSAYGAPVQKDLERSI